MGHRDNKPRSNPPQRFRDSVFSFTSHNVGFMDTARIREYALELEENCIDFCMLQGTRWIFHSDITIGGYKCFPLSCAGGSGTDAHTGCMIGIKASLLDIPKHIATNNKMSILDGRILAVRHHTKKYDITLITALAPGENLPQKQKTDFWKALNLFVSQLPDRSMPMIGIDTNGHMGGPSHLPNYGGINPCKSWNSNRDTTLSLLVDMSLWLRIHWTHAETRSGRGRLERNHP
jgi:hypothetical protein